MDKSEKALLTNLKRQRSRLLNLQNVTKDNFEEIQTKLNLIELQIRELTLK